MTAGKKTNWARIIAFTVVAIIVGALIGWKAYDLSETAAALEPQRHAADGSTVGWQGFSLKNDYSPLDDAHSARLSIERYGAQEDARNWRSGFIAYIVGVVLLGGVIFVVVPSIERAAPRREDLTDFRELGMRTKARLTAAASSINKAIPRQPTVGGLSTADELRKWESLRKEGLITDEEYQKMRDKLVG